MDVDGAITMCTVLSNSLPVSPQLPSAAISLFLSVFYMKTRGFSKKWGVQREILGGLGLY